MFRRHIVAVGWGGTEVGWVGRGLGVVSIPPWQVSGITAAALTNPLYSS
jgi:hypothetical protein